MTGTIDVKLYSDHPDEKIPTHYVYVGSPSVPRIVDVPTTIGNWTISGVWVCVTYPDGTMHSVGATLVDGTYVATVPKCDVAGTVTGGFQIVCSGQDENEEPFEGLCLGCGDLTVLPRDGVIRTDATVRFFHIVDEIPYQPVRYDTTVIDGAWMWYDGAQWLPFGGGATHDKIADTDGNEISANLTFRKTDTYANWTPSHTAIPADPKIGDVYYSDVFFGEIYPLQNTAWSAVPNVYHDGSWYQYERVEMEGDSANPNAIELTFPDGTKTYLRRTIQDTLALVSQLPAAEQLLTAEQSGEVAKVKDKADEFSEWVAVPPLPTGREIVWVEDAYGRGWAVKNGEVYESTVVGDSKEDDSVTFHVGQWSGDYDFTATRKRVLRTGDAATPQDLADAISAENDAFSAAVEEIIRRQNNAQ